MLNEKQIEMLKAPLSREHVSERTSSGRTLSYVEGYYVIDKANEIFGFDGWNHNIEELKLISSEEVEIGARKEKGVEVVYMSRVVITVAGQTHSDVGTGNGRAKSAKDAHELAMKESVTDGMKRALRHWGNQFGNCLYDKTQKNVTNKDTIVKVIEEYDDFLSDKPQNTAQPVDVMKALNSCTNTEEVESWRLEYRELINNNQDKEQIINAYKEIKTKFRGV